MDIKIDIENKCIRIDGELYDLAKRGDYINYTSVIIGEQVVKELNFIKAKIDKKIEYYQSDKPQPTKDNIDVATAKVYDTSAGNVVDEKENEWLKKCYPKKKCEVLSFSIGEKIYNNVPPIGFEGEIVIRSVKRNSDGVVFSIGDEVEGHVMVGEYSIEKKVCKITSFEIMNGTIVANYGNGGAMVLSVIKKQPPSDKGEVIQNEQDKKYYETNFYLALNKLDISDEHKLSITAYYDAIKNKL